MNKFKLYTEAFMPLFTEVVIFVLTIATFAQIYEGDYGKAMVFGLLIIAAQLQKISDILVKR